MRLALATLFSLIIWDAFSCEIKRQEVEELTKNFFNNANVDNIGNIKFKEMYDPNVEFSDPLIGDISGYDKYMDYIKAGLSYPEFINLELLQLFGDCTDYVSFYKVYFNRDKSVATSYGMSYFKFSPESKKIIYQRDVYDLYAYFYSKIPWLNFILGRINSSFYKK